MDKAIVTGLLIIASVVAATILVVTISPSIKAGSQSVSGASISMAERIETEITIITAEPDRSGQKIDIWLKNAGSSKIMPVSALDLILRSIDGRRGEYVPQGVASGNGWVAVPASHQVWHRGETLRIQVSLADALSLGKHRLSATTPNGVSADMTFEMR